LQIERLYYSITVGVPDQAAGEISTNIDRHPTDRLRMAVCGFGSIRGREAISTYRYEGTELPPFHLPHAGGQVLWSMPVHGASKYSPHTCSLSVALPCVANAHKTVWRLHESAPAHARSSS
jgi:hypothetical protein